MKQKFLTIQLPATLLEQLDVFCAANTINRSAFIRKLIEDKLSEETK